MWIFRLPACACAINHESYEIRVFHWNSCWGQCSFMVPIASSLFDDHVNCREMEIVTECWALIHGDEVAAANCQSVKRNWIHKHAIKQPQEATYADQAHVSNYMSQGSLEMYRRMRYIFRWAQYSSEDIEASLY